MAQSRFFNTLRACLLLSAALLLSGCYVHLNEQAAPESTAQRYPIDRVLRDIVYTEPGWPQQLRADLYLPTGAVVRVREGNRTRGGTTVLAEWP